MDFFFFNQRENGLINFHRYPQARYRLMDRLLPEEGEVVASMIRPTFCGQFSDDGQRFISACQDYCVRLYDTSSSRTFNRLAEIGVEDVGWSILDTALSPDRTSVAYSTWSDCSTLTYN
jgi:WD repeat-containing protein 23